MKAFLPKNVFFHTLKCNSKDWTIIYGYYEKISLWKGKLVAVGRDDERAKQWINARTSVDVSATDEPVLYISPDCKISRDVLRQSGFKITYNRDNCPMIVIPSINPDDVYETHFNICVVLHNDANDTFLDFFAVEGRNNVNGEPVYPDQIQMIKDKVKAFYTDRRFTVDEIITNDASSMKSFTVTCLPKCDEYLSILNGDEKTDGKDYVFDTDIVLTAPIDISVDTFTIWKSLDTPVLAKAIVNSNWKEYPIALALFLYIEKRTIRYQMVGNLKTILSEIGFIDLYDRETTNKMVTPKDWKLWSDYTMSKYNVNSEGGFTSKIKVNTLPGVRCKVAVAPFTLTEPMSFDNILSTIKALK